MRRFVCGLAAIAMIAIVGCEDSPSDPAAQPIVGTWTSSKVGSAFAGASNLEFTFDSDGSMKVEGTTGGDITGSYTTSGSSASSDIREITVSVTSPTSMSLQGIYQINGNQMKLELVPKPAPSGVTPPNAVSGIGSTVANGSTTNAYVTELHKQ